MSGRKYLVALTLAALSVCGCDQSYNNEQLIYQYKQCRNAGMEVQKLVDNTGRIVGYECVPPANPAATGGGK